MVQCIAIRVRHYNPIFLSKYPNFNLLSSGEAWDQIQTLCKQINSFDVTYNVARIINKVLKCEQYLSQEILVKSVLIFSIKRFKKSEQNLAAGPVHCLIPQGCTCQLGVSSFMFMPSQLFYCLSRPAQDLCPHLISNWIFTKFKGCSCSVVLFSFSLQ